MVFGMRRLEGIDEAQFQRETGYSVRQLAGPIVDRLSQMGLVTCGGHRLMLTRRGLFNGDYVCAELLSGVR